MATVLANNLKAEKIKREQPVALFSGDSVEITNAWQDISCAINVKGVKSIVLWLTYDVNTSVDTQIRILAGDTASNCVYSFPIDTVGSAKVEVQDEVIELAEEDVNLVRQFVLDGAFNFIKIQVKDSADGTGQIDSAKISIGL